MARILTSVTALLALSAATCLAQDPMLEDLYGRGVHAFFSGNIRGAFDARAWPLPISTAAPAEQGHCACA